MSTLERKITMRQKLERKIARALILQGLAAGYAIVVDNGEEETPPLDSVTKILKAMFATDEEHLRFFKDGKYIGWVFFVYGNDGWDVINDYTINLEPIMTGANRISDQYA